jgi:GMP synthase (glutamine-hydrolysing)
MKRILALQHVWENPEGYVGDVLRTHNIAYDLINVEEQAIPDPTAYAGVIAFGGSQHVYDHEKYPYFQQEEEILRQIVASSIPYLGICLGGQLLAEALGGTVKRHTLTEFGFYDVHFTEEGQSDPLYAGLPGQQKVFHWHEDTFVLPPSAILLATNGNTRNQAFRYGNSAYGLQYHIELNDTLLDSWLYHPELLEETLHTFGKDTFHQVERDRESYHHIYLRHSRQLVENFLRISHLI